jgi:hypothetical protein
VSTSEVVVSPVMPLVVSVVPVVVLPAVVPSAPFPGGPALGEHAELSATLQMTDVFLMRIQSLRDESVRSGRRTLRL